MTKDTAPTFPSEMNDNPHTCQCTPDESPARQGLDSAECGAVVKVCCIEGFGRIAKRLAEMGFVPGTEVRVVRKAPLADPVEYELRGYLVSLRREEAAMVRVQQFKDQPEETSKPHAPLAVSI